MATEKLYLKQNVQVEPLYNQWYAWSYLISPATAAMYVANLHLKIMQSFVSAPQIHVSALKNPAMRGGPFINYDASKVGAIKSLMEKTIKEQAHMLALAEAIKSLDALLTAEADGGSLEPLYPRVPEILKGYVELVYDLNNNPSMRFIEGLLYKSPYYNLSSQSITLSLVNDDNRPFAFSTPVLPDDKQLHLTMPFKHEGLDELFKMKRIPQTFGYIKEQLSVRDEDDELFSSFFTEDVPQQEVRYNGEGVRIRYFGHACVLIESKNTSIICDPVISYKIDNADNRYTYADLPEEIDYALITHTHQDHNMFETLLQLRHKIRNLIVPRSSGATLADQSLKLALQNIGFRNVIEIDEMESIPVADGSITGIPFLGEHADLNIRSKTAYLVRIKDRTIILAADSNNIEPKLYQHIHDFVGDVDVLFIGMECEGAPLTWLYGPLLTKPLARKFDQSRRFNGSNFEKGMDIVEQLKPKQVYVYAMGQEPWLTYLTSIEYTTESRPIIESDKLINSCRGKGMMAERLLCQRELFLSD
ncbi:MAG: MBL fold metallo-hydrolase [Pyrinomonadaceae bacterium]|nr:MBL fold metallo-hydrolase [Pyrinomonadaceae bacterium]MBD0372777.1 MBL fold metallo-hydrolase [Pyrinomonadaceae bacterium]